MVDQERHDAAEQSLGALWRGWGWGTRIAVVWLMVAAVVFAFDKGPGLLAKVSGWASSDVKSLFEASPADQAAIELHDRRFGAVVELNMMGLALGSRQRPEKGGVKTEAEGQ